jgi:hypothetical protein
MKASELRIGNLVFNPKTDIAKIRLVDDGLGGVGVQSNLGIFYGKIEEIEPIPLTEDWLIRMGFEKNGPYWFDSKDLLLSYSFSQNTIAIGRMGIYFQNKIQYVHQLQNLYFALTGEELIIKDDTK